MKKLLILICLFVQFWLPVLAEYKPIPKALSKQYKKEIEQVINRDSPKVIKAIDKDVKLATKYYNYLTNRKYDIGKHVSLTNIAELIIPSEDLDLYSKIMKITVEKYLGEHFTAIPTDSTVPVEEFLYPYFKDNEIDISKLTTICEYQNKKIQIVEKYLNIIQTKITDKN